MGLGMGAYRGGKAGLGGPRAGQIMAEGTWNTVTKKTPGLKHIPIARELIGGILALGTGAVGVPGRQTLPQLLQQ